MSAIGGAFNRTAEREPESLVRRLALAQVWKGPDAQSCRASGPVAMHHDLFDTGAEPGPVDQPHLDRDGFLLAMDGRLDNRGEVLASLRDEIDTRGGAPALILGAYRKWGVPGLARLHGDFCVSLWDPHERRLILARDAMGVLPLYWRLDGDLFVWASSPRSLVDALDADYEVDEEFVADFIANTPSEHGPFNGLRAIAPGHAVVVTAEAIRVERFFSFDASSRRLYRDDAEYEEELRELFVGVMRTRLRSNGPVFAELSGGVDSSSIVCVGDRVLSEEPSLCPRIETVSYVFECSPSSDERDYIGAVETWRGRQGMHIGERETHILGPLPPKLFPDFPTNQLCFLGRQDRVAREMRRQGGRVLLSGLAGDGVFFGEPPELPLGVSDLAAQGRWIGALRSAWAWSRSLRAPFVKLFFDGLTWRRSSVERVAKLSDAPALSPWLDTPFARRLGVERRSWGLADDVGFCVPSASNQYATMRRATRIFALDRLSSEGPTEMRFPYLDRRLLEFALSIPFDQKIRPEQTRSIVRRALGSLMPELIGRRCDKAGPAEAFFRALAQSGPALEALLAESRSVELGFVDPKAWAVALQRARLGLPMNMVQLVRTLSLELWLRTLDKRRALPRSEAESTQSALPARQ
jgi:asparagine synthase (glutamine-hydrolysing)